MDIERGSLKAALEMQSAGDIDGAVKLFEDITLREPKNSSALLALGALLNRRGEFGRALALLERAVLVSPSDPTCHVELGESFRNLGDYRDAIGSCLVGLRLKRNYPEGWNTLGLALRGSGDLQGALEKFLQAVACRAGFFAGHKNAGRVLVELGRFDEAALHFQQAEECSCNFQPSYEFRPQACPPPEQSRSHFEEVARLGPDQSALHLDAGDSLQLLGRSGEARTSYLKAIRLDPGFPLSYLRIGMSLRLDGRLDDALPWYRIAIELEPDDQEFLEELADLYQARDEPNNAVACWRHVLELSSDDQFRARMGLGLALQQDGSPELALEQFLFVRGGRPTSAQANFALSGVYQEIGEMSEAEFALREAIRLQPNFPAAYARLATMLRGKLPDRDLRIIETQLCDPDLEPDPRARLLFANAHVLDAHRRYSQAASCLWEANKLALQARRMEGIIYSPEEHEQFVDRLIKAFDVDFFRRTAGLGLETRRPIFVFGLPRSGTSLVEQILASHPRIYGAGERLFARRTFESLPDVVRMGGSPLECVPYLDEYSLKRLAGEHLGRLNSLDSSRFERIIDKLPDNYIYVGMLAAIFPNAVFVNCRRDLRDVAVSCWMSDFRSVRWANHLGHIGLRFNQYRRLMNHWRDALPVPIIEVHYEDTVSDLEHVARRILDGCRLEWNSSCLNFHATRRSVQTASVTQVRQPIYHNSVARWKNYQGELGDFFATFENGY